MDHPHSRDNGPTRPVAIVPCRLSKRGSPGATGHRVDLCTDQERIAAERIRMTIGRSRDAEGRWRDLSWGRLE
jgi:hypothetical protein